MRTPDSGFAAPMRETVAMTRSTTTVAALVAGLVLVAAAPTATATQGGGAPSASTPSASVAGSGWRARMLTRVNAVRAEAGIAPLASCGRLGRSAQHYAAAMARSGAFGHVAPDGTGGLYVAGASWWGWIGDELPHGEGAAFLGRFDAQGMKRWIKPIGAATSGFAAGGESVCPGRA